MDVLKKIEKLKNNADKFEKLAEDLCVNLLSKQKKIDLLKEQIQENVEKIDKIVKKYNADT